MSIRISGGEFKGRTIKTLPGMATRPTTARVREAIFSILQHDLDGADVLDLFSGSGALAIEAISRGVSSAVMVEKNNKAAGVIKQNLETVGISPRLLVCDYKKALQILDDEGISFDLIFADPPYALISPDELVNELAKFSLVKAGAMLIMEHAGTVLPEDNRVIKTRRFGDSAISLFRYE
ncbi:MAG: 16S rRNA (guanine(966)-N(2))-methyltransferase RsmD [candidate division Zixibacteria bacterium]|nr:16S rRNA (guanine(966)-N(2))-methyltransferase RsmD [candidate division Zixibacteria bacterium]